MTKFRTGATLRFLCLPPPSLLRFPGILSSFPIGMEALIINLTNSGTQVNIWGWPDIKLVLVFRDKVGVLENRLWRVGLILLDLFPKDRDRIM